MLRLRPYFPARGVYGPRPWIAATVGGVVALALNLLLIAMGHGVGLLLAVVLGLVVGLTTSHVQCAIWRRRHPAWWEQESTTRRT